MGILNGKRVFVYAPVTYDYHERIARHLEQMGADVTLYREDLFRLGYRLSNNVSRRWNQRYTGRMFDQLLGLIDGKRFDLVFVIYGKILDRDRLKLLRQLQPHAKFVMYQWDSLKARDYTALIDGFDRVYSFDPADCSKDSRLNYLPLFHSSADSAAGDAKTVTDLLFVGTLHSDRLEICERLAALADEQAVSYRFYLYVPYLKYVRRTGHIRAGRFIHFEPVDNDTLDRWTAASRVVLDINFVDQSGLTMRTFEALGAGKKLMTTNHNIVDEPFYDPAAIALIDRNNLELDLGFIRSPIPEVDLSQYRIENWLQAIVS